MEWFKPVKQTRKTNSLFNFGRPKPKTSNLIFGFDIPKPARKVKGRMAMNWMQAKKVYPKLSPFADNDRDGVQNWLDCRPFDRTRQSVLTESAIQDMADMRRVSREKATKIIKSQLKERRLIEKRLDAQEKEDAEEERLVYLDRIKELKERKRALKHPEEWPNKANYVRSLKEEDPEAAIEYTKKHKKEIEKDTEKSRKYYAQEREKLEKKWQQEEDGLPITSKKFRNKKTGEIKTQIPILSIRDYEEVEEDEEPDDYNKAAIEEAQMEAERDAAEQDEEYQEQMREELNKS